MYIIISYRYIVKNSANNEQPNKKMILGRELENR